ncbi:MAG: uracil-DNA glycosylase family 4 [Paracoccaceae bacterium]
MATPTLLDYLHQLRKQGVSHIEIDDPARSVLRELYTRGSARRPAPQKKPATATPTPLSATTAATTAATQIRATGHNPAEKIASLAAIANTWPPAKALGSLRDTMVFSVGNPEADLMLVGEAPGYHDEQKREPFVGPSGVKLDQILSAMGLSRNEVYISNVCKFRPATKNQTINNRKPSPEEMATSIPFLKAEIDVVKPRAIIALGASAAQGLLGSEKPLSQLRESWHQFQGIPLRVTFHPSYLLRQEDGLGEKRKVWEDMLAAMEKLGLPVSKKQRAYFR